MYINTYMGIYTYICISFQICFLIEDPGLSQGQVTKLVGWELCDQGSCLSSVPYSLWDLGLVI